MIDLKNEYPYSWGLSMLSAGNLESAIEFFDDFENEMDEEAQRAIDDIKTLWSVVCTGMDMRRFLNRHNRFWDRL